VLEIEGLGGGHKRKEKGGGVTGKFFGPGNRGMGWGLKIKVGFEEGEKVRKKTKHWLSKIGKGRFEEEVS